MVKPALYTQLQKSLSLLTPSLCRPTAFATKSQVDKYIVGFIRTRRGRQYAEHTRRLVFGRGHNASIPALDYFNVLADISELSDCLVYIRFLGTKSTLAVDFAADIRQLTSRIQRDLVTLDTPGLQHRMDICLSVTGAGTIAFINRPALTAFVSQMQVSPQYYHILNLTSVANLQATCHHNSVKHVNFYTAILQNIRDCGELPTKKFTVMSHELLSPSPIKDFRALADTLVANGNILQELAVTLAQLSDRSVPARFEVTTDVTHVAEAQQILSQFVLGGPDSVQPRQGVLKFVDISSISDYVQAMMVWAEVTLKVTANELRTRRAFQATVVKTLVLLEDQIMQSFLYGQCYSVTSRLARTRGVANNSDLAIFSEFDADLSRKDLLGLISKRLVGLPHYLVSLAEDMQTTPLSSSLSADAHQLAFFVLLCLNAEVEKTNYRRQYATLDNDATFLFQVDTLSGLNVQPAATVEEAANAVYRVFFIRHEVKSFLFNRLHDFAIEL